MVRTRIPFRILLLLAALHCVPSEGLAAGSAAPVVKQAAAQPREQTAQEARAGGDVYILRGGAGVFSTGLLDLSAALKQRGVASSVISYQAWRSAVQAIIANRQKFGRRPVVIVGHSLGANNAIKMANALKAKGIDVDLIVSLASTSPMSVPANVREVDNFYFKVGGWGGLFSPESGFSGKLSNEDVSVRSGMTHFNIDDDPALRGDIVRSVLRYVKAQKSAMLGQ